MKVTPTFIFLFLITLSFYSAGFTHSKHSEYVKDLALSERLYESQLWLKLLNYSPRNSNQNSYESVILSPSFFLADNGRIDPKSELLATIDSFFQLSNNDNEHSICRFPARFLWLNKMLHFDKNSLPRVQCSDYEVWHRKHTISSISIVFATGYLGNPASYYGHLLLKLNSEKKVSNTSLLDTSVNFGAIVPDAEDPLTYIAKGLFGGYDSGFTHISYYFHTHNYGETEMRDLWEYELDLSPSEVEFLVAHTWEVLGKKYTYYFLNKNCAYRMAELIELLDGVTLLSGNEYWLTPQEIIQNIENTQRAGKPLIREIHYFPSRQSRLYSKFSTLTNDEKSSLKYIIYENEAIEGHQFQNSNLHSKHKILDTLLDYYQFITVVNEDSDNKEQYRKMLSKRYQLAPGQPKYNTVDIEKGPHRGRPASRLSVSSLYNEEKKLGSLFHLRPAYYDELDAEQGHVANSSLKMAALSVDIYDEKPRIRQFDIVDITSIHRESTSLPGDKNFAWKLNLGIHRQNLACESCNVLRFRGDAGLSFPVLPMLTVSAFVGGAIQDNRNEYNHLFAQSAIHTVYQITDNLNFKSNIEYRWHVDSPWKDELVTEQELRLKLSNQYDIRASYNKNVIDEWALSLGYYF